MNIILNIITKPLEILGKKMAFDAIRGIAVLLVLFSHLDNYNVLYVWPLSKQPLQGFLGQLGVHMFFLLSGALIWMSALKTLNQKSGLKTYFINRFTRIYPLYVLSIIVVMVLSNYFVGAFKPVVEPIDIIRHLFFLQNFKPSISDYVNSVLWTLPYEVLFYLTVPFVFYLNPSKVVLLISIFITQILWILYPQYLGVFICYWTLFASGILIVQSQLILKKTASLILFVISTILIFEYPNILLPRLMFAIAAFNMLLAFNFKHLVFKPLVQVGVISYSVYIWHRVLILFVAPYFPKFVLIDPIFPWLPRGINLNGIVIVILIFCLSTASYFIIEKPSMTLIRKKLIYKFSHR